MKRYDKYAESGEYDYQTHVFTSTYTADVSGVCSAMYELGGMTILHDPSGCNSTYSTHDEPRWFDTDSLMFVSGLDEITAVLGDDSVLIEDAARAAADLQPRFITLCGGSIPHITAFDYKGVAKLIERRTGVPTIPVVTNGNRSYVAGVGAALTAWVKRFGHPEESPWRDMRTTASANSSYATVRDTARNTARDAVDIEGIPKSTNVPANDTAETFAGTACPSMGEATAPPSRMTLPVNLLGVTPLDFSTNGNVEALCALFAPGETPNELSDSHSGSSSHISGESSNELSGGLSGSSSHISGELPQDTGTSAESKAGTTANSGNAGMPVPTLNCCAAMGETFDSLTHIYRAAVNVVVSSAGRRLARYMQEAAGIPYVEGVPMGPAMTEALLQNVQEAYLDKLQGQLSVPSRNIWAKNPVHDRWDIPGEQILIIGEEIFAQSLAATINALDESQRFGRQAYAVWPDVDYGFPEHEVAELIRKSSYIIADPLYRVIPHDEAKNHFIDFPHEAYSGRIYRTQIPMFAGPGFRVEELLQL